MGYAADEYLREYGELRKNEFEQTLEMLRDRLKLHVIGVDASDRFLAQLKGVTDPRKA